MKAVKRVCVLVLMLTVAIGWAQTAPAPSEQGHFNLHKFEQLIGKETYTLTRSQNEEVLKADFKFVDRGSSVPLTATLTMEPDLTPTDFQIKGKISRFSSVDNTIHGRTAGQVTIAPDEKFFDIDGYAPVSVQMMLVRYWHAHGSPKSLKTLPRGEVEIQEWGRRGSPSAGGRWSCASFPSVG